MADTTAARAQRDPTKPETWLTPIADEDLVRKLNIASNDIVEIFNAHHLDDNQALAVLATVSVALLKGSLDGLGREQLIAIFAQMMRGCGWEEG